MGTKGIMETHLDGGIQRIIGEKPVEIDQKKMPQALVEEHRVLLDSVQNNKPLNMLREMVNSTLMAIAGRESCYSGLNFKYDWIKVRSKQSFAPKEWKLGQHELEGVPLPGVYKLS